MLSLKTWKDNKREWENSDVQLPKYDVNDLKSKGEKSPKWIHIGAGNLYRTFHAEIADDLADKGLIDRGVVVANMRSAFAIDNVYRPFNNDIFMVTMCVDGALKKRVLSSTSQSYFASPEVADQWSKLTSYFENPELQMVTYTITEKGYAVKDGSGNFTDSAKFDIDNGPKSCKTAMGLTASLLLSRFNASATPIAMTTTDNFSQNGQKFRDSVLAIVEGWRNNGFVEQEFVNYVSDEKQVSFPWSMIDRITPNPSAEVAKILEEQGFADLEIVHTPGGTGFSSFANTEETSYLVIEDSFPNGRPPLEEAGVIMCDRKTAELADTMKVTACLNPLHTAMAIFGCLLGYTRIWQEMEDDDIVALIKHLGYEEDLPVLEDPKVLSPKKFIDELITKRLPNKSLPDAPQRIACDTSQKIPIRYGHTVTSYVKMNEFDVKDLHYIPLIFAAWLRYLMAVDDKGEKFELSSDPMLEQLCDHMSSIRLGENNADVIHNAVKPILSNKDIFAQDLYEIGLAEKVEQFFIEMNSGPGAIRETLHKNV